MTLTASAQLKTPIPCRRDSISPNTKNGPQFANRFQHFRLSIFLSCICFGISSHRHLTRSLSSFSNLHGIPHHHSSFVLVTSSLLHSKSKMLNCCPSIRLSMPYLPLETRETLYPLIYVLPIPFYELRYLFPVSSFYLFP